jgi:esterase/lipase
VPPILPLKAVASSPEKAAGRSPGNLTTYARSGAASGQWPRHAASAKLAHKMRDLGTEAIFRWAGGVALALAVAACVPKGELALRHTRSAREIPMPSADFAVYVAAAEVAIAEANQAIDRPLRTRVIEERAPFELVPGRGRCPRGADGRHAKAALLLHDLGGTPYEMRDLGRVLAERCYLVRAILLPGHGTVPGDLLEIDYRQWIEATRSAVASFEGEAEQLVLVGFGLGATLAVHHVLSAPPRSDPALGGLVLLAPALGTDPPLAWLRVPLRYGQPGPQARWARLLPDYDPVRYESLPRNAEIQRARLVEEVVARDALLEVQVFLAISADDAEVDPGAARDWFCRRLSGPRRLIWYTTAPGRSTDCRFVAERSSAAAPDILDLSHVALPIAPDNPRYGIDGSHHDCSHYYWEEDTPNWLICVDVTKTTANSELRYGEITEANLQRHVLRRLTYNPDFEAMVGLMLAFLADPNS